MKKKKGLNKLKSKIQVIGSSMKSMNEDLPIDFLRDAWRAEADCGCGIDCCDGTLHLSKDGVHYVGHLQINEEKEISLVWSTKEDYKKNFSKDKQAK